MVPVAASKWDGIAWNSTRNVPVHHSYEMELSNRCHARVLREATARMADYGIDWARYHPAVLMVMSEHPDFCIGCVEWRHRTVDLSVTLGEVWFDRRTGEINQCGTESGDLVA